MRHVAFAMHIALRLTWAVLPARAKVAVYKRYRAKRKPVSFQSRL